MKSPILFFVISVILFSGCKFRSKFLTEKAPQPPSSFTTQLPKDARPLPPPDIRPFDGIIVVTSNPQGLRLVDDGPTEFEETQEEAPPKKKDEYSAVVKQALVGVVGIAMIGVLASKMKGEKPRGPDEGGGGSKEIKHDIIHEVIGFRDPTIPIDGKIPLLRGDIAINKGLLGDKTTVSYASVKRESGATEDTPIYSAESAAVVKLFKGDKNQSERIQGNSLLLLLDPKAAKNTIEGLEIQDRSSTTRNGQVIVEAYKIDKGWFQTTEGPLARASVLKDMRDHGMQDVSYTHTPEAPFFNAGAVFKKKDAEGRLITMQGTMDKGYLTEGTIRQDNADGSFTIKIGSFTSDGVTKGQMITFNKANEAISGSIIGETAPVRMDATTLESITENYKSRLEPETKSNVPAAVEKPTNPSPPIGPTDGV